MKKIELYYIEAYEDENGEGTFFTWRYGNLERDWVIYNMDDFSDKILSDLLLKLKQEFKNYKEKK